MASQVSHRYPVARFSLGNVVVAPRIDELIEQDARNIIGFANYLTRHSVGDWGDLKSAERARNEHALIENEVIRSSYRIDSSTRLLIVTEANRRLTTLLLDNDD